MNDGSRTGSPAGDRPLVSVILPVFNGARFLAETLSSVLAQTHHRLELIVVDDGSSDESAAVVHGVGGGVRYVYQPNSGTAVARNAGVTMARGSLFAFIDQDDVWPTDKLALQVAVLRSNSALDMVFGMVTQFTGSDSRWAARPSARSWVGHLPSALLVRRRSFFRVGLFDPTWRLGEWADWYLRAVGLGLTARVLPQTVAYRRLHSENKGVVLRALRGEYARILKAGLDRRRRAVAIGGFSSPTR